MVGFNAVIVLHCNVGFLVIYFYYNFLIKIYPVQTVLLRCNSVDCTFERVWLGSSWGYF